MAARSDDPFVIAYMQIYANVFNHFARASQLPDRALCRAAGCSTGFVSLIRTAQRLPSLETTLSIDRTIEADGVLFEVRRIIQRLYDQHLIQAQHPDHAPTLETDPQPSSQEDDMERRALLQLLTALGAGTAIPTDALEKLRRGLDSSTDTHADSTLEDWERTAWEYGHTLITVPAAAFVGELASDVVEIRAALKRTKNPLVRAGLHRVSAQLAAAMAMCLLDLGDAQSSWRWWRTARRAADASGDLDLRVWVRSREAHNGRYGGRHETIVTQINDEAIALAKGNPSAGLASALAGRALLSAAGPDHDTARTTLRDLGEVYEQLPATITADTETQWGWPESTLHNTQGGVHARLGDTNDARTALDRAWSLYPSDRFGARAQMSLRKALCLVHDGDVDHGLDSATATVAALPEKQHLPAIVVGGVKDVLKALPDQARALPAARELRALTSGT